MPLTRQVVLDAAREQVSEFGLASLSSRSVAARLDVTPMALYRHVRDMDEIIGELVDQLLAAIEMPPETIGWRTWLEHFACSLRGMLRDHPAALGLFTRQPVTSPAARRRLETAVLVLAADGFTADEAIRAYASVHTYTVGFSTLETGRRRASEAAGSLDAPAEGTAEIIHGFVTEEQFLFGVRALVAGFAPQAQVIGERA